MQDSLSGEKCLEKTRTFSKVWYSVCLLCALLSRGSLVRIQHGSPFASPSSSLAQDIGLSRRQHGFKSRRGRQKINYLRLFSFCSVFLGNASGTLRRLLSNQTSKDSGSACVMRLRSGQRRASRLLLARPRLPIV